MGKLTSSPKLYFFNKENLEKKHSLLRYSDEKVSYITYMSILYDMLKMFLSDSILNSRPRFILPVASAGSPKFTGTS